MGDGCGGSAEDREVSNLVSVIVSSFNRPRLIRNALDSIVSQDWPTEIIVADDWSNRETSDVLGEYVEKHRVTIVRPGTVPTDEERQFGSRCAIAINAALPLVTGAFVCFLPDDDMMPPGSIAARAQFLVNHPEVNVVLGRLESCMSPSPQAGIHWMGFIPEGFSAAFTSDGSPGFMGRNFEVCTHDRNGFWPSKPVARIANRADHSQVMVRVPCDHAKLPRWPECRTVELCGDLGRAVGEMRLDAPSYPTNARFGEVFDCPDAGWFYRLERHGFGPFHGVDAVAVVKRYHARHHRTNPAERE